jgi:hypothetical protein
MILTRLTGPDRVGSAGRPWWPRTLAAPQLAPNGLPGSAKRGSSNGLSGNASTGTSLLAVCMAFLVAGSILKDAMSFRKNPGKHQRAPQEQVSDLAYHLWEARGRPLGSPEVDWLLAESLVKEYRQASPFDEFLWKATNALNSPTIARGVANDAEYARVIEERRYVIDILDRVEMLAFTYSRLKALSGLYRQAEAHMDNANRVTREEPLTWEVPDKLMCRRDYLALEARVLASFVYYELTSLAHMLNGLKIQILRGELQYLVKARDKFLAHPMFRGRVRNAHGAMSIPQDGLLHAYAIHADETDPVLLDYYRVSFAQKGAADEVRLRSENEKLILSRTKNSDFSPDERLRLKAFGVREPSLDASLQELASLLMTSALPEIERVSAQPIPSRR